MLRPCGADTIQTPSAGTRTVPAVWRIFRAGRMWNARGRDRAPGSLVDDKADHYAAAVYGSIVAAALIEAFRGEHAHAETIALSVLATMAVFWLAHVWSAIVGERIHRRERGSARTASRQIARAEWPLVEASFAPVFVLHPRLDRRPQRQRRRGARAHRLRRPALRLGPRRRPPRLRPLVGPSCRDSSTARSG